METHLISKTLYQIREEHIELIYELEEADGILTPEIEQALIISEHEFQSKAVSFGFVIKSFEDTEEIITREIKRLTDLKNKSQKRQELFKAILSEAMQQFRFEKIETPTIKLSFRKSEAVEITDENLVPAKFREVRFSEVILKAEIKAEIKAGEIVPGAELVTRQNLQIK